MSQLFLTGHRGFLGQLIMEQGSFAGLPLLTYEGDLIEREQLQDFLMRHQPCGILHLAALSKPQDCQDDPEKSWAINVGVSELLAHWCHDFVRPMLFTSSEQVYSGEVQNQHQYFEDSWVGPIDLYGDHKLLAETLIKKANPISTITRMGLMFGKNGDNSPNFLPQWVNKLRTAQSLQAFSDEIRTPLSGLEAIKALELAWAHPANTFHVVGEQAISRFELAVMVAKILKLDPQLIIAGTQEEAMQTGLFNHRRPRNLNLNNRKLKALGWCAPALEADLTRTLLSL